MTKAIVDFSTSRFLIADDKAFIRNLVRDMLVRLKAATILHADSGEHAIEILGNYGGAVDCIISDWNMAPVSGLELLRAVRTGDIAGLPNDTRFIMLTGNADSSVVAPALALDVSAYLVKPVSYERFVQALERAFQRSARSRTSGDYRNVTNLQPAPEADEREKRLPPWVLWIKQSPKRAELEHCLHEIRSEARTVRQSMRSGSESVPIKNPKRSPVDQIGVGAVLAEDVFDTDGVLLVATGTVLTKRMLSRLTELASNCDQEVKLWVGEL